MFEDVEDHFKIKHNTCYNLNTIDKNYLYENDKKTK